MRVFGTLCVIPLAFNATIGSAQPSDSATVDENNDATSCNLRSLQPPEPWNVNARQEIVAAVRKSNECLAQKDSQCMEQALTSISIADQSADETALLTIQRAELANLRGERELVAELYTEAMNLPALDAGLRRTAVEKLAERFQGYGLFRQALTLLDENFDCDTWTANALALRGIVYQSIAKPTLALENFEAALRLYEVGGKQPRPGLRQRYESLVASSAPPAAAPNDNQTASVIPIITIPPKYPSAALRRRLDGWVRLQFTISETGSVEDIRAVASSADMFEEPAIAAVKQWRYAPRTENGLAVRREGVETMIRFGLEQ